MSAYETVMLRVNHLEEGIGSLQSSDQWNLLGKAAFQERLP
jgi:hypothetical protein